MDIFVTHQRRKARRQAQLSLYFSYAANKNPASDLRNVDTKIKDVDAAIPLSTGFIPSRREALDGGLSFLAVESILAVERRHRPRPLPNI